MTDAERRAGGIRRRRWASGAAALAAALLVPVGAAYGSGPGGDWPQADHDASANRANATETTITPANAAQIAWVRGIAAAPTPPGGAECGVGWTTPILAGTRAYAVQTGRLVVHDLRTGALVWQRVLETGHLIEVAQVYSVAGGRVFVGSLDCISGSDPTGTVQAFDASTGARLWSRFFTGLTGVSVTGTRVVAAGSTVGSGSTVEVLDAATGAVVWRHLGEDCAVSAVVSYDRVYYEECDQNTGARSLVAAAVSTGAVAWRKPGSWPVRRADAVGTVAKHLYAGTTALNPATGATRFTLAGTTRIDAVDATRVYAACGAVVCAFTRATGVRLWTSAVPASSGLRPAVPALAGALLYTPEGTVLAAATGAVVTRLWGEDGQARELSVGNGYVTAVVDGRVLDVYGLPGS